MKIYLTILVFMLLIISNMLTSQVSKKDMSKLNESIVEYNNITTSFRNYYRSIEHNGPGNPEYEESLIVFNTVNSVFAKNASMQKTYMLCGLMNCAADKKTMISILSDDIATSIMLYKVDLDILQDKANYINNKNVTYHLNVIRKYLENFLITFDKYKPSEK